MFYYEEKATKKPKDVAKDLNVASEKVSEWAKDLERYNVIRFHRTPFGSLLFKESEIKIIKEYGLIKSAMGYPKEAIDVFRETNLIPEKDEDMSWAKKLNYAIWRRH